MQASPATASETPHPGYRRCVGALLLDRQRRIFIGERTGPLLDAWQMPQGGVDSGETPAEAARRELIEETGVETVRPLAESRWWYAYDLPPDLAPRHWQGRWRGQTQRWFAYEFLGSDDEIRLDRHQPEFRRWRWATPPEVLHLVVPFKQPVYRLVLEEFSELLGAA